MAFQEDQSTLPRVDVVAVHDIDETLQKAWIYRKKTKRRTNDSRTAYFSGGMNSLDGERGIPTGGSPAPGRHRRRLPSPSGKKKPSEDHKSFLFEKFWASSDSATVVEENPRPLWEINWGEQFPEERAQREREPPEPSPGAGAEGSEHRYFNILEPVPEHDDPLSGIEYQDPSFWQTRNRRRSSLFGDRRKVAGPGTSIDEEKKGTSTGEIGEGRTSNIEVMSDRPSSVDHRVERRVNWLSDPGMLPGEIPGARVMLYTYKSSEKEDSPEQYLSRLAQDLIERLNQRRISDDFDYEKVPIILVGLGFGALVVQKVVHNLCKLADSSQQEASSVRHQVIIELVAGVILLDPPSPFPSSETYPRSLSQESKKTWTQDWLGKPRNDHPNTTSTKIDPYNLWAKFKFEATRKFIPIVWHYNVSSAAKVSFSTNPNPSLLPLYTS